MLIKVRDAAKALPDEGGIIVIEISPLLVQDPPTVIRLTIPAGLSAEDRADAAEAQIGEGA